MSNPGFCTTGSKFFAIASSTSAGQRPGSVSRCSSIGRSRISKQTCPVSSSRIIGAMESSLRSAISRSMNGSFTSGNRPDASTLGTHSPSASTWQSLEASASDCLTILRSSALCRAKAPGQPIKAIKPGTTIATPNSANTSRRSPFVAAESGGERKQSDQHAPQNARLEKIIDV